MPRIRGNRYLTKHEKNEEDFIIPDYLLEDIPNSYLLPNDFQYNPQKTAYSVIKELDNNIFPFYTRDGKKPKKEIVNIKSVDEVKDDLENEGVIVSLKRYEKPPLNGEKRSKCNWNSLSTYRDNYIKYNNLSPRVYREQKKTTNKYYGLLDPLVINSPKAVVVNTINKKVNENCKKIPDKIDNRYMYLYYFIIVI